MTLKSMKIGAPRDVLIYKWLYAVSVHVSY